MLRILPRTPAARADIQGQFIMQNVVALCAYFFACFLALLFAARWILRNHPALRERPPARPPCVAHDDPPGPG
ncbi:hypothetical protein CTP10_R43840 [Cupriavidus sp. P-10]|uniref:hypothetical protein n=1 Tax=Cupriavidus sp. P-10 TaxID=2027911 RepID=UPI000E2EBC28|nr:hypothetical protein [Cupriavidus sp. P-10]BDB26979.1 hypothetical protein CTP10_R43840 [Cupriavidus sp. P-10]